MQPPPTRGADRAEPPTRLRRRGSPAARIVTRLGTLKVWNDTGSALRTVFPETILTAPCARLGNSSTTISTSSTS